MCVFMNMDVFTELCGGKATPGNMWEVPHLVSVLSVSKDNEYYFMSKGVQPRCMHFLV